MKKTLDKVFDKLTYGLAIFAAVLFCLIIIVLLVNIILRTAFDSGITGQYEIVQYGIMICVGIGMARTTFTNRHIHVDLLTSRMGWRFRSFLEFFGRLLCTAAYAVSTYLFVDIAAQAAKYHKITDLYRIPFQYIYWVFLVILAFCTLVWLYQTIVYLAGIFVNYDKDDPKSAGIENSDAAEGA